MFLHDWALVEEEPLNPKASRKVLHTETMTVARLRLKEGAFVPRHSHANEQITLLESGRLLFHFDDHEETIETGQSMRIPGNVPHAVTALVDSVAVDIFSPPRADWIRGDDAYLRGGV